MRNENPNWPAATYNGFAGATPPPATAEAEPRRRALSRPLLFGGIATAVAAGVALGFVAQPKPVSAARAEAAATPMNVELAQPAPLKAQPAAGKLDVRPTDAAPPAPSMIEVPPPPAPEPAAPAAPAPRMTERVPGPPVIREVPPRELELDRSTYEDEPALDDEEPAEPNPF